MLKIYKKVEKKQENLLGSELIEDFTKLNKPFLFCISAQDAIDKSVHGIIKIGARAARINTNDERAAGFKLDEVDVDFLGGKYNDDKDYPNNYDEMVDKAFYPFLISKGKSVESLKKQARKMNFLTYCNGTSTYVGIENKIEKLLKQDGFKENDINEILSQISLVAVETIVNTKNLKCNSITFLDVNDNEFDEKINNYKKFLGEDNTKIGKIGPNGRIYTYKGNGVHSLKGYFSDECIAKPAICASVSKMLQKSIENEKNDTFNKSGEIAGLDFVRAYSDLSKEKVKMALEHLDKTVTYGNASKYSVEEAKEKAMIEDACKEAFKVVKKEKKLSEKLKMDVDNLKSVIDTLKQYSLDGKFSLYDTLKKEGLLDFSEQENKLKKELEILEKKQKVYNLNEGNEIQKINNMSEKSAFTYEIQKAREEFVSIALSKTIKEIEKRFGKEVSLQVLVQSGQWQGDLDDNVLKKKDTQISKIKNR